MDELVLVGLGANLGDIAGSLARAGEALRRLGDGALRRSSLWRSAPVDCPPGSPDFLNAVVLLALPDPDPAALLQRLLEIELEAGRVRSGRNAPRTLDLDLLLVGDAQIDSVDLALPHPRAHLRGFVLAPAAELVPELVWPGTSRTVRELLEALPEAALSGLERLAPDRHGW